jgi:hypothetical protein
MLDRLFGRGKQELPAEPTCASCGRTLLPGEWAQTIVRDDGVEEVVCSLCVQAHDYDAPAQGYDSTVTDFDEAVGHAPSAPVIEPIAVTGRPQQSRGRVPGLYADDAYAQALRDKDAEIARLQAQIAQLDAHNQRLNAQLAALPAVAGEAAHWAPEQQWAAPQPAQPAWDEQPVETVWPAAQPAEGAWSAEAPAEAAWSAEVPTEPAQWEPAEAAQWQPETVAEAAAGEAAVTPMESAPSSLGAEQWADQPAADTAWATTAQEQESAQFSPGQQVPAEGAQWAAAAEQPQEWAVAAEQPQEWAVAPAAAGRSQGDAAPQQAEWATEQPAPADWGQAPQDGQWPQQQADWTAGQPGVETADRVAQQQDWAPAAQPQDEGADRQWRSSPAEDEAGEETAEWSAVPVQEDQRLPGTAVGTSAAAAVTDEWTGVGGTPVETGEDWSVAPLESVAPPVQQPQQAAQSAMVDMPTEPIDVFAQGGAPAPDYCPACDTDELEAVPRVDYDDDATMQLPAATGAQQIVFEPQPEPEDLHLLERGADLFNVSPMRHKVAESNELLGMPAVHLSSEDDKVTALFLWSMAWYEYRVDLATGDVVLAERGYEDRGGNRPNGLAKSDGTIQVAPLPARRAVVQPAPLPNAPVAPAPAVQAPIDEDQPSAPPQVAPGNADIISKSLKGQRTDDEGVAWDEMAARDFDWGR